MDNHEFDTIDEAISKLLSETAANKQNIKFTSNRKITPSEALVWLVMYRTFYIKFKPPALPALFERQWRNDDKKRSNMKLFQPHGYFRLLHRRGAKKSTDFHAIIEAYKGSNSYRGTEPISCHNTLPKNFSNINNAINKQYCERIIVMGVGPRSLRQNLQHIRFEDLSPPPSEIWFTCYDSAEMECYEKYFKERFGEKIKKKDFKTCTELAKALAKEFDRT